MAAPHLNIVGPKIWLDGWPIATLDESAPYSVRALALDLLAGAVDYEEGHRAGYEEGRRAGYEEGRRAGYEEDSFEDPL
jgi:hypothetical protein